MRWTDFFDHIYLINLERRTDRLLQAKWELDKYSIPYIVREAVEDRDGKYGIYASLRFVFANAMANRYKNILVFEDDLSWIMDPNPVMEKVISEIPDSYDMLYLGVNLGSSRPERYSDHLIKLSKGYALHACAYSLKGVERVSDIPYNNVPIDVEISDRVHPAGNCYATYPMLCTQRPGFSNIEKTNVNYCMFLQDRFDQQTQHFR